MDQIDKSIIFELLVNCRTPYQKIAKKLNLSVNAVKKRIDKLMKSGIIRGYALYPSFAMLDAESFVAIITTKEPTPEDTFLDTLGANPMIFAASILTDGDVLCFGHYVGSKGLDELGSFFRQQEEVEQIEIHTILSEKGGKCELGPAHLKVLRCLLQDVRMPIVEITKQTGLSSRRVNKILEEFAGEEGSEPDVYIYGEAIGDVGTTTACLSFRLNWNLNAGGYTAFIVRIGHERGAAARGKIVEWIRKQYPFEFWYAYTSAFEPIIFSVFVIEHMRQTIEILETIRRAPGVISVRAIFGYPTHRYLGLTDVFFENILSNDEKI